MTENVTSSQVQEFATASIKKLIIKFGIPGALGMLLAGMQTIIDGLFIGRFVGVEALASVNIVMPSYSAILAICVTVGVGSLTVMGMSQGKGKIVRANNALRSAFMFLLIFSISVSLLFFIFAKPISIFMGADDSLISNSATYLSTLSIFMPAVAITFMGDYFFRAVGKPIHGLCLISTTVISNIVLDYLLIAKFDMGIMGAAIATGASFAITAIFAIYFMLKPKIGISLRKGKFSWLLVGRMAYNGSSEGVSDISAGITLLVFNVAMMEYLGSEGVAGFAAVNYILYTAILIFVGISNGMVPIISYIYGAGNYLRLKSVMQANIVTNLAFGIIGFLILYFGADRLISIFFEGNSSNATAIAVTGAKIVAFAMLFNGINVAISSIFTAIGDARSSIIVSALRGLVLILIGVYTLPLILDVNGVWASIPFAEVITITIAFIMLKMRIKTIGIKAD